MGSRKLITCKDDKRIMAKNFKIIKHQNNACLHLKLQGDFDGSSAFELINVLKKSIPVAEIYIHAENLGTIHPFGSEVFEKNIFEFKGHSEKIFITGRKG